MAFVEALAADPGVPAKTAERARVLIPVVSKEVDQARANHIVSKVPALKTVVLLIGKIPLGR